MTTSIDDVAPTHVQVGWVHGLISTPLSIYLILYPSKAVAIDPIFAYGQREGSIFAISAGYFLYDFWVSLRYIKTSGWPFVLHATACCFIFFKVCSRVVGGVGSKWLIMRRVKAYTPFLMGYGSSFLVVSLRLALLLFWTC